jgi:hypothetical protein
MKRILSIIAIIACICNISFVFADDVSEILNSIRPSNPNQESQSQGADVISTQIPPVKEINTGLEATSTAKSQLSKEVLHTSLSSLRDGEVIVASYNAHLSAHDHFSSTGSRLANAAAIIRQDRANFHKFGLRDAQDQNDDFFSNARNREALEQMLNNGDINPLLAKEIINGNPLVFVRVIRASTGSYYMQAFSAE